jgi:hypothetical protein
LLASVALVSNHSRAGRNRRLDGDQLPHIFAPEQEQHTAAFPRSISPEISPSMIFMNAAIGL